MAIERERWDMGEGEIRSQERGTERRWGYEHKER